MEKKRRRIVVDVSEKFHNEIKKRAQEEYMTMKGYILRALVNQVWKDKDHENK